MVTIVGNSAQGFLNIAGITTVTTTTAIFSIATFNSQRIVALYNSAGTLFKGIAYVRRYLSANSIELETRFFDPVDGSAIAQVAGDKVLVSKNWAESATTGIAVSGVTVTLTQAVVFGTNAVQDSVCFYDESKYIETASSDAFTFAGGCVVWGHLESFAKKIFYGSCTVYTTQPSYTKLITTTSSASDFFMFGGSLIGTASPCYVGGYLGSGSHSIVLFGVYSIFDQISPGAGGSWGAFANRCVLNSCLLQSVGQYAILVRWGDGVILGGNYKIPRFSSLPLSIFGTDTAGSYLLSANPNDRLVVSDIGNSNSLIRTSGPVVVSYTCINIISTDKGCMLATTGVNTNATMNFYFKDRYINVVNGSIAVATLDSDSSIVDSISSISNGIAELQLYHEQVIGVTSQFKRTAWTIGFKKYGLLPVILPVSAGTYDLGASGFADDVSFGGNLSQIIDSKTTLSQASANALVSIGSLDDAYDSIINWSILSASNAAYPSVGIYPVSSNGSAIDATLLSKIVFDSTSTPAIVVDKALNTVTLKSSSPTPGVNFTSITGNIELAQLTDLTDAGINGAVIFTIAGTYNLTNCNINNVVNNSGGSVIINSNNTIITTNTGPNITINNSKQFSFTINKALTAYEWRIYQVTALGSLAGAVELAGQESSNVQTNNYSYNYSVDISIAVQIIGHANKIVESTTYYTLTNQNQAVNIILQDDTNA